MQYESGSERVFSLRDFASLFAIFAVLLCLASLTRR